jgi:MATE family multidrug resistance protein
MGAAGAAWGTVAGDLAKAAAFGALFLGRGNRVRFGTLPRRILEPRAAAGLMRGGFGNGIHLFLSVGSLAAFNLAAGACGGAGPAGAASGASAVAFSFGSAALVPVIGLGSALALLVGHGMGAGRRGWAAGAVRCSGRLAFMYLAGVAAVCLAFPDGIVSLFSGESASPGVRAEAARLLALSAAFVLCDGFSVVFCGAARGAGDTCWVMKMTGCVAAAQCVAALGAGVAGAGPAALWGVRVLGSFFKALLGFHRLSGREWLTNATAGRLFGEVSGP